MVAIRKRDTNSDVPYVFRYPEWEEDIYYPFGSCVSYLTEDSDGGYYEFFVAVRNVPASENTPPTQDRSTWKFAFSGIYDSDGAQDLTLNPTYVISNLLDVGVENVQDLQLLAWNDSDQLWRNVAPAEALELTTDYGSY